MIEPVPTVLPSLPSSLKTGFLLRSGRDTLAPITATVAAEGADISRFESAWERLFAFPGNEPSTSFEWTAAMLRHHLRAGDRVFLLELTRGSEPLALVPLLARSMRVLGCPVLVLFPISDLYNTHGDVLSSSLDEATVGTLMDALYALPVRWDVFRMSNVLEGHALARHFAGTEHARRWSCLVRDRYASYYLDLPPSFDEYLAARSAKFRNHLKRTERKVHAEARVAIREFTRAEDMDSGYEMLLEIERGSWKHAHGTAITAVPHQIGFYRDLCRGAAAHGRLHLQVLMANDRPVAYDLGYLLDGGYSYLKTSYVDACRSLGVATYLRANLIRSLIGRSLRFVDFPAEPYEWERQWTDVLRWHKTLSLYRPTPAGAALAMVDRLRHRHAQQRTVRYVDPRTGFTR